MTKITVNLPAKSASRYSILIGTGLLDCVIEAIPDTAKYIVIITDNTIKKRYASELHHTLQQKGYKVFTLSFPPGERHKNIKTKCKLENAMLKNGCDRNTCIMALGGGVVGDMAGFIAATYMRGINYIQIPTTLLAMVDSSVGGKTAIDTPYGKNLIGAFWQPIAVYMDINTLTTLPKKHLINGLIEAIKVFITHDKKSFDYVKNNIDLILNNDINVLTQVIKRAIKIKATIIEQDETENNIRMVLNFGHTVGHALEHMSHYTLLHGYAVAYGILVEAKISEMLGHLHANHFLMINDLLNTLGIKTSQLKKFDVDTILKAMRLDKKSRHDQIHYVLINKIGQVVTKQSHHAHPVDDKLFKEAFLAVRKA